MGKRKQGFHSIIPLNIFLLCVFTIGYWTIGQTSFAQKNRRADLALVLAVDCSHSVDNNEYDLQMQGLAQALSSEEIIAAILSGPNGSVVITVIEWAGVDEQVVSIPWTIISNANSMQSFANNVAQLPRSVTGNTSISTVISFADRQFSNLPINASRLVIDISADGVNNIGALPKLPRMNAIDAGITINGLAIINEVATLDTYFEKYIIGGQGHFVLTANDYASYQSAIKRKLLKEIRGEPIS